MKSNIPGSRLNILERAKGDKNGGDGFATEKMKKLIVLENFVKTEMRLFSTYEILTNLYFKS